MENLGGTVKELRVMGGASLILGALAILAPFQRSLTFEICIGTIFVVVGTGQALHSIWGPKREEFFFELFGGVHYLLIGLMLLGTANSGVATVTLLLALLLIMQGMIQFSLSSKLDSKLSKECMLASGSAAVLLGIILWSQWTSGATLMVGLFVGIHLLLRGLSVLVLTASIRQERRLSLSRLGRNGNNEEPNRYGLHRKEAVRQESQAQVSVISED